MIGLLPPSLKVRKPTNLIQECSLTMLSIGIGSKTSTGGVVIEGNANIVFDGLVASSVGHKATCPACKKGVGEIVAVGGRTAQLPAGPAARAGDYIACGCPSGSNTLIGQGTITIDSGLAAASRASARPLLHATSPHVSSDGQSEPISYLSRKPITPRPEEAGSQLLPAMPQARYSSDVAAQKGSYDPTDADYHRYDVESAICQIDSVCTMESVSLANRMHPAPGTLSNTVPVVNGQISNAHVGYTSDVDDFGSVIHSVSPDGLTVRNTTLAGHKLFPGYVERTVFQRGDTVYIRTFGEGIGPMGAANEFFAKPLWNGLVDGHVRYRVNLGYRK